jgi:hypothetical protein
MNYKTATGFFVGLALLLSSATLCQGQCNVATEPGQILTAWGGDTTFSCGVNGTMAVGYVPGLIDLSAIEFAAAPAPEPHPMVSPEPSALGLFLAGSAALWRFGARKRSL